MQKWKKIASIFIVEDDPSVLDLYGMILEAYGFSVIGKAKNGQEAVEMYRSFSKKPDVILMDHRMPIKSGIEASKEILKFDRKAKIIIASGDNTIKEISMSIGISSFINKPMSNQKLVNEINKVLQRFNYQTTQRDVISQLKR